MRAMLLEAVGPLRDNPYRVGKPLRPPMAGQYSARRGAYRVRYRVDDDKVYSGTVGYTDIAVRTQRGEFGTRVSKGPGSRAWPIPEAEHRDKFLSAARYALPQADADALLERVLKIAQLADVRELTKALEGA